MSRSPFLTTSPRRSRELARRRARRRRRTLGLAVVLLVVVGVLVLGTSVVSPGSSGSPRHAASRIHARSRPVRVALSPSGIPLGTPPLRLGLSDAAAVHLTFPQPPRAGMLVDLDTGRVLWQRNALTRVRIASLTKMMTALLVVEHAPPNAPVLVTKAALDYHGSGVGVLPYHRHVPLEALLAGLLLPSGNDAAIALAQHVSHTVTAFVSLMNQRAAQLGLGCTRYSSPSGYYDRGNYSCAADLAVLASVDIAQRRISDLSRRASVAMPFPIKGGRLFLYNNNPLVREGFPGVTGLKTGYTLAAGPCLVATATRGHVHLGVVLLDSPNTGAQAAELLDRAFHGVYRV